MRVIQDYIRKPPAEEPPFGKRMRGGAVKATLNDGKLDSGMVEAESPALPKPDRAGDGGTDREQETVE